MKITLDKDFKRIACEIVTEDKTLAEWAQIESDDMFQRGAFSGGFDATEGEFCFSYEHTSGEYWFQLSLEEIQAVERGDLVDVEIRPAG